MQKKRFVVIGNGNLAYIRVKSLLATNRTELVGICYRNLEKAKEFGNSFNCYNFIKHYKEIPIVSPDFILVTIPHKAQDEIVIWALNNNYHLLIGSVLASSIHIAYEILNKVKLSNLVVEVGFEARYKAIWKLVKKHIENQTIGNVVAIQTIALANVP